MRYLHVLIILAAMGLVLFGATALADKLKIYVDHKFEQVGIK